MIYCKRPILSEIHPCASISLFVCQYSCCCVSLTLRSINSSRFVPPATGATIFRSDKYSSIVSPRRVALRCLIDDLYDEPRCALVPNGTDWYCSVPNLNSYKLNEINRCFRQLIALFASLMYANMN
jgi:hypothetical protein